MLVTFEAKQTKQRSLNNNNVNDKVQSTEDETYEIQNIDKNNPPDIKSFNITRKKHKGGCITCKIRKKRCSEERPLCADCSRLGKNCVWATEDMSVDKIRELKRQVEESERSSKRKRSVSSNQPDLSALKRRNSSNQKQNSGDSNKIVNTSAQPTPISPSGFIEGDIPSLDGEMTVRTPKDQSHQFPWEFSPVSNDHLFEFNNFFESNLRSNSNKISDHRITDLSSQNSSTNTLERISSFENLLSSHNLSTHLSPPSPDPQFYDFSNLNIPRQPFPIHLQLDNMGSKLYDYYQHQLARIISIVPPESNYYLKVFLPMAAQNKGILYAILAWSGYHLGGDYESEGQKYMSKALDYIKDTPARTETELVQRLANLLIMCGAEICKGDVRKWPVYLDWASKVIKQCGGLSKLKKDKEQHWLMTNFAYHDILASSTSERGTYFSVEDYNDNVVKFGFGINPLQGLIKPLFNMIGEISTLAIEVKRSLTCVPLSNDDHDSNKIVYNVSDEILDQIPLDQVPGVDSPDFEPTSNGTKMNKYTVLSRIMEKAKTLEDKITNAKPDSNDLGSFSPEELELQFTLFELFQLTAKLHLRQSILQVNPSSLESQHMLCGILRGLDIVLKSPVESSLCFPLFIAGMHCITRKDRKKMLERFADIGQRYAFKNLERAKAVMEQVWIVDPLGSRCVDWYDIVKKLGWDLNFA
ncbi:putative transcriptional regulatory protein [Wickerhamomyces ciferrii]|uniref:Transcriptional regulatory protein n=1 Tax=Wickerhamomyces ciferrii (strain ATCC 14091 / BCRC 22168 / CBS 111 / JCM 3599 / NBRC 0793 / NRRL Y-1031 F-60-10) TaxID=1206466 RepID=K0KS74_WICCF|nr:putative transcriptional regulatory protein [Wickerhamomyces ciferrii]CCH44193.1 putative transcriptional regulatory protein [Wickerhamomyces ciferrii]